MRILILLILAATLSSCGEKKEQVLASCQLQYMRNDGVLLDPEWRKVRLCMESHGFTVNGDCSDPYPASPECFKRMR
jgi:hypothetical protein